MYCKTYQNYDDFFDWITRKLKIASPTGNVEGNGHSRHRIFQMHKIYSNFGIFAINMWSDWSFG